MARDYAKTIAHLLANAEDESLPEEARASYRTKAEAMMREYRIAEEDAIATEGAVTVPVSDTITIMERWAYTNPLRSYYWQMWSVIARHCEIRCTGKYSQWGGEDSSLTAVAVGYPGDIKYAELLFTAARIVFLTRIDARVDRSLSDQENCYYMRGSGQSRKDIATALWGSAPNDGAAHGKVQKLYVAECSARGEVPKVSGRGIQVDVYREAYARGFVNELGWRLMAASAAVDKVSGGLVLKGRKERVNEAFYSMFPDQRPRTAEEEAAAEARWAQQIAECEGCKKTTSKTGLCERHRPVQISAAQQRRYHRLHNSAEAYAGMRAGESAAADVHIGRSGTKAPRTTHAAPTQQELA